MLRFLANAFLRPAGRPLRRTNRPRLECLEDRLTPSTLFVDDDRVQYPKAQYTSIQAAIDAAKSGDDIRVYPGTYSEQLSVVGAGKNNLTIESATGTAPLVTVPAKGLTGNEALLTISGSQNVHIHGLSLKGDATAQFGIRVDTGASATIDHNTVSSIGDPNGAGIFVGQTSTKDTTSGKATISDNKVSGYGKAGIVVLGAKYKADVEANTVIGSGDNAKVAQNGIQISNGANADVEDNDVSGNRYTGPAAADAAGILLLGAGSKTEVECNSVHDNEEGILVANTTGAEIENNRSWKNTADGISLLDSANIEIECNETDHNGGDGISVYGDAGVPSGNNRILGTSSHDNAGNGIYLESTSKDIVCGNAAFNNKGNGILLSGVTASLTSANSARKNGQSGIALSGGSNSNNVSANDAQKNGQDGIEIVNSAQNTVNANSANSNGRYGISETQDVGDSVQNTYFANQAKGNASADFLPPDINVKKKKK